LRRHNVIVETSSYDDEKAMKAAHHLMKLLKDKLNNPMVKDRTFVERAETAAIGAPYINN